MPIRMSSFSSNPEIWWPSFFSEIVTLDEWNEKWCFWPRRRQNNPDHLHSCVKPRDVLCLLNYANAVIRLLMVTPHHQIWGWNTELGLLTSKKTKGKVIDYRKGQARVYLKIDSAGLLMCCSPSIWVSKFVLPKFLIHKCIFVDFTLGLVVLNAKDSIHCIVKWCFRGTFWLKIYQRWSRIFL